MTVLFCVHSGRGNKLFLLRRWPRGQRGDPDAYQLGSDWKRNFGQNRSFSTVAMQTVYRLRRPGSWNQPTPPTIANNPYRCGLEAEAERACHPRSKPPSCVSVGTTNTAAAPPPPLLPICHQEFGDKAQYEESGERAARGKQEGLAPNGGADRMAK